MKKVFTLAEVFYPIEQSKRFAFTLAEVLITLGIIGVVAALTMPSLIQNHKKQTTLSKLKKISAALGQANSLAVVEYGNYRENFAQWNADEALEMFEKYYTPYMKIDKVEKGKKGVFAYLTDGTALYFFRNWRTPEMEGWYNVFFVACLTHNACKALNETSEQTINKSLGVERFILYTNGMLPSYHYLSGGTRAQAIEDCKNGTSKEGCSALIGGDSWQIKKDYPFKF